MANIEQRVNQLRAVKEKLVSGGDKAIQEKLKKQGIMTARERVAYLLDRDSFIESDLFVTHHCNAFEMSKREIPGDAVVTGYGEIEKRPVFLYSQDFSAMSGTLGKWTAKKICRIMDLAGRTGAPLVGINHSLGARLEEMGKGELGSAVGFGEMFYRNSIYSGVVPQISVMMGDNAGGQVYGPGITDFIVATRRSNLFIAGPVLVKSVMGEEISAEELGGAEMHAGTSGVVHIIANDDKDCLDKVKTLLSYLPSSCHSQPPFMETGDDPLRLCPELNKVLPENDTAPFDMHRVINVIVDKGYFLEIHKNYARNMIVGFARFGGMVAGIITTNSIVMAGAIDVKAAEKATRFVRFCDAFNIPLVYLQDNPAYLVGSQQERQGMIYRGSTLIFATSEATVPKIAIMVRKALAGSYLAMGSLWLGGDINYAWVNADMTGLGPDSIADVIYRREIRESPNPEEARKKYVEHCRKELGDIYDIASWQNLNDVIEPAETRVAIIKALKMLKNKRQELPQKKHNTMPL